MDLAESVSAQQLLVVESAFTSSTLKSSEFASAEVQILPASSEFGSIFSFRGSCREKYQYVERASSVAATRV